MNFFDLCSLFIIKLTNIIINLKKDTIELFAYKIVIINPVVVAKFFYTIYNILFSALLTAGRKKRGLLEPILIYFSVVETNDYSIL